MLRQMLLVVRGGEIEQWCFKMSPGEIPHSCKKAPDLFRVLYRTVRVLVLTVVCPLVEYEVM